MNILFYLLNTDCHWRMLPKDFPEWQVAYLFYGKWKKDGTS
ncbi:MAG: transposase [Dysgonamonadaceae bacterium]|nr:transposase [Dysgonamonadaceae bacterium]